jgi:hypothetical protein
MHVCLQEDFVPATNSQKTGFPHVPLEITVRNKVPAKIYSLGISFLEVISHGTMGSHIFWESVNRKNGSQ